ncbi:hypothetical protein [Flavobacterium sp. SM2513]|uniref:hypothetical protein n=1 Tax=Flavobacterium sp. SM2513 TaxID=3424766 RepID=UPI003D7F556D
MIEIYKTNISRKKEARQVAKQFKKSFPNCRIDFDLEDCDRILRIDTFNEALNNTAVLQLVLECGFYIEVLADEIPLLKN